MKAKTKLMMRAIDRHALYYRNLVSRYDKVFSDEDIQYLLDENLIRPSVWNDKPCYELTSKGNKCFNWATGFYWWYIKHLIGWYKLKTWMYQHQLL